MSCVTKMFVTLLSNTKKDSLQKNKDQNSLKNCRNHSQINFGSAIIFLRNFKYNLTLKY